MNPYTQYPQLQPEDTFRFSCRQCGECCRNVKDAIMVESLDLFRLARYFQLDTAETANRYMKAALLDWGAPVLMLKTKQHQDACVFLKSGKCSVQTMKPRTCRLYPLSIGPHPYKEDAFVIFKVSKRQHHFTGDERFASAWVDANFSQEDRDYINMEYKALREFGRFMRRIPQEHEERVMHLMLSYRYFLFDTGEDFLRQYARNMASLKMELQALDTGANCSRPTDNPYK